MRVKKSAKKKMVKDENPLHHLVSNQIMENENGGWPDMRHDGVHHCIDHTQVKVKTTRTLVTTDGR